MTAKETNVYFFVDVPFNSKESSSSLPRTTTKRERKKKKINNRYGKGEAVYVCDNLLLLLNCLLQSHPEKSIFDS